MKLNCDLGEGFGHWQISSDANIDSKIMPHIQMANIACGFHASDPLTMAKTVKLAKEYSVSIGAHPSYPDLVGFGRRSMKVNDDELVALIQYQIGALQAICHANGTRVDYVKPHGALYNDMMANQAIFISVCQAIALLNKSASKADKATDSAPLYLVVQALPNSSTFQEVADVYGVSLRFEAFADRNYQDNGLLVPRSEENAVLSNNDDIIQRCKTLKETGKLTSINKQTIDLKVDTLCVHGDHPSAVHLVEHLAQALTEEVAE